jgi:uncharacterized repeat protein (TIGR02543 family)
MNNVPKNIDQATRRMRNAGRISESNGVCTSARSANSTDFPAAALPRRRRISAVVCIAVLCCCLGVARHAAAQTSGVTGDCTWTLTDFTLTIAPADGISGAMADYTIYLDQPWYSQADNIKSVVLQPGVTNIGASAFSMLRFSSLTIPNSVTSIGQSAFYCCYSLSGPLTIPNSVTKIEHSAFMGCGNLTELTIPNSVISIGEEAFSGCGCSGTTLTIPNSITTIEYGTFRGCGFSEIIIPSSVTTIGQHAFTSCGNLTEITIPATVTSTGSAVFAFCGNLTDVYVKSLTPLLIESYFFASYNITNLYVPCGTEDDYRNAAIWQDFPNIEEIPFDISVSSADPAMGSAAVTLPNTCANNNQATITATPLSGYAFTAWSDGVTAPSRTVTVTSDTGFVAVFDVLSVTADMINILGDGEICVGQNVTLTAEAPDIAAGQATFRWYRSQTDDVPFFTGAVYTTSLLTADTTFFISAEGGGYVENARGNRRKYTVELLDPNTQGTDFYVSFGRNYNRDPVSTITMQIRIVAQKATTVSLTYNNDTELNTSFAVDAGSVYTHSLSNDEEIAVYSDATGVSCKSLHIHASEPVSVYALNQSPQTTDATFVLPVDVLGTEYFLLSYMPCFTTGEPNISDGYTIVATVDGTEITEDGQVKATLRRGEVYSCYEVADMTGRHIMASHPVACFVTNHLTTVPNGSTARDHLYEQMIPVNVWGKRYAVPVTVRGIERVRIVASQDNTTVTQEGGAIMTVAGGQTSLSLDMGEFVELEITKDGGGCYIEADKPVGVASYLVGRNYTARGVPASIGDPSLTVVPPVEQMVFSADIAPFIPSGNTDLTAHYVMIITPAATRDQTAVSVGGGAPATIEPTGWTTCVNPDFAFYTMQLTSQTDAYHFANPNGLLVMGFGVGGIESYCYLSGAAVRTLNASFSIDGHHYKDLNNSILCAGDGAVFRASGISPDPDAENFLVWYVNGNEIVVHDEMQWGGQLSAGACHVRLDVTERCRTYSFETEFTVVPRAEVADIIIADTAVCYNTPATLKPVASSRLDAPRYNWYRTQSDATPFLADASSYTTSRLKADTVFYIGVSGSGLCENATHERKAVAVYVDSLCAFTDYVTASCDDMPVAVHALDNDTIACADVSVDVVRTARGSASFDAQTGVILYDASQSGPDTIYYRLACGADVSESKVCLSVDGSAFVDDVWYWGRPLTGNKSVGIRFVKDADGKYAPVKASGESNVNSWENSLVVSSPYCNGQTIFYSGYNQLYNSQHAVMPNGSFAGNTSVADGLAACYMGENKYLFFAVTTVYNNAKALHAYVVDMNADNGGGDIIKTVEVEPAHDNMSESIELIAKAGTTGEYWLIYAHSSAASPTSNNHSNELRVRSVNVNDPDNPVITVAPGAAKSANSRTFTLSASSQYNRLAISNLDIGGVDVFDFNSATGTISPRYSLSGFTSHIYGVAFSPDGNQLYCAEYSDNSARLYQYDISSPAAAVQVTGSPVQYWSQTENSNKGNGLKLGPDGKIYVTQSYTSTAGAVSDPNSTSSLASRYNMNALDLGIRYDGLQFSTGLTRPSVMSCNANSAPVATPDEAVLCVSGRYVGVDVAGNDTDADGDVIFLTGVEFVDADDADLATLYIDADGATVILKLKDEAVIDDCRTFEIIYHIKDDGLPASQCSSGTLSVAVCPPPAAPAINSVTACYDGAVHSPVVPSPAEGSAVVWYMTASGDAVTSVPATAEGAVTAYAAVRIADTGCESARTAVTVTVTKLPDVRFDASQLAVSHDGDAVRLNSICIENTGHAPVTGIPVAFYTGDTATLLAVAVVDATVPAVGSVCTSLSIDDADIRPLLPFTHIVARLNDDGNALTPPVAECDESNNFLRFFNPALDLVMEIHASVVRNSVVLSGDDGFLANPVAVLSGDTVVYYVDAVNPAEGEEIVVLDTLPLYMNYTGTVAAPSSATWQTTEETPVFMPFGSSGRYALSWKLSGVKRSVPARVTFRATPVEGANASQPLYVNRAWVNVSAGGGARDAVATRNSVYHQGAGTSFVTFSASRGGSVYNADRQAVDYGASPRAGVIAAPDDGYVFDGWSHPAYLSHRGAMIPAASAVARYDTLAVYGDVALRADFSPVRYSIRYDLNGAVNAASNPSDYTVESPAIVLDPPVREGDVFAGWTGSNGDVPQLSAVIPARSVGDRFFQAVFYHASGRAPDAPAAFDDVVWAAGSEVFIRADRAGVVVHIYAPDGVLHRRHTILYPGVTRLRLPAGVYLVTLNNAAPHRIVIRDN